MTTTGAAAPSSRSVKTRPLHDGDFEHGEITGRNGQPCASTVERSVFEGAAHHEERQPVAAFEGHAAGGAGQGDAGQRVDARHAILHETFDARRLGEALAGERHSHGQDVLGVEARVHGA